MESRTHESFEREPAQRGSSNRSFGLVFALVFALIGVWPMLHKRPLRMWSLGAGALFLAAALAAPGILSPLNRVWTQLGRLLSKVTNPVITGVMFYVIFTPLGAILKMMGKDPMRLRYDPALSSYWIRRDPAALAAESMRNQF